jgi:hypothetical protein
VSTTKQGENGLGVEAQRGAVRRYLFGHHGEQIAEFVEVESGKRSERPQLAAAMALANRRKAASLLAKLDRLSRSVAFIAAPMDSKGFDLVHRRHTRGEPADASRARRRCRARAAYDWRAHAPCARRRQGPRHQAWQSRAGQDHLGEGGPTGQALRPHIERCIAAGRTSSSAVATDLNARGIAAPNGGQWFPMEVRRVRDRLGL